MDINFEILVVLTVVLFVNTLYIISKEHHTKIIFGIGSALAWFIFSVAFMIAEPTLLAFSFVFLGLGLLFTILTVQDMWTTKKEKVWEFG